MESYEVDPVIGDPPLDLALQTIAEEKQALVFVNTKRSAEASAEKIGRKNGKQRALKELAEEIKGVLSSPTKQCERLAYCVERGTAFHHSGLVSKQRHLVEQAFIDGDLRIICATPTLAAGVNVPAFRTIIRDLKRYTGAGMDDIPVLEYHQMAGRAGRPDFNDDHGEAVVIGKSKQHAAQITDKYLRGAPEAIWSKVASLPVLRTYCLSLVASEFVHTKDELKSFFQDTLFAHQYGDTAGINQKIEDTVGQLKEWEFLHGERSAKEFTSADELAGSDELKATAIGRRVSELYLDPLSAHQLLTGLKRAPSHKPPFFAYLHLLSSTKEMRPLLRVKMGDYEGLADFLEEQELLVPEPSIYDDDYEEHLAAAKTAKLLSDWADEKSEEWLLETYNVRPGELRYRNDIADWLLYGASELSRLKKWHHHISECQKARTRLKYGVKEELLPLLKFKNVGRVRARRLYKNGIRDAGDVKQTDANTISQLFGPALAKDLKKQVGQDVEDRALSPRKRKGQLSLDAPRFNK